MTVPAASLFVIAAPSGAGKTSLVHALVRKHPDLCFSISYTTRARRANEAEGVDYFFVSKDRFEALRRQGEMLESALVFDNLYGTSRSQVEAYLQGGKDVVLEIDWQGARQVREHFQDSIGIFVLPPSRQALQQRLQGRGQDDEQIIARRMRDAVAEMKHYDEFDYLVINDDFDLALQELRCIVQGQHLQSARQQQKYRSLLDELLQ